MCSIDAAKSSQVPCIQIIPSAFQPQLYMFALTLIWEVLTSLEGELSLKCKTGCVRLPETGS